MRQIPFAIMAVGLALVLAACASAAPESEAPIASVTPSPVAPPSASPSASPPDAASPSPSVEASLGPAADEVLEAALATQAEGTVRYTVDVRSADPDDTFPAVTATGQASFADPAQFHFASEGVPGTVPASEDIFDGSRLYVRGREASSLPPDTWLMLEITEGTLGYDAVMRQYGDSLLVLVTPLGVTSAERAEDETIGTRAVTRYVSQVDVAEARRHLPESVVPAYDARVSTFQAGGIPTTHEVEIYVDDEGRIARTRYLQELQGQDVEALVITYDFDGYGDPMDAAPQPGDEVLTVDEARERYQQTPVSPSPS